MRALNRVIGLLVVRGDLGQELVTAEDQQRGAGYGGHLTTRDGPTRQLRRRSPPARQHHPQHHGKRHQQSDPGDTQHKQQEHAIHGPDHRLHGR